MRFDIRHNTCYSYSVPVDLGPQLLRLRPQDNGAQQVLSYACEISPRPAGSSELVDIEGNRVLRVWFNGSTRRLQIKVETKVETLRVNPFDYLPASEGVSLLNKPPQPPPATAPYIVRPYGDDPGVAGFVSELMEAAEGETLRFLGLLNERMHSTFTRTIRHSGSAHAPAATLKRRKGACRDLAVLFMDCCRAVGLPARFASGYQKGDGKRQRRFMHAWPEVYVLGGGWRGYDPTHGLAVADEHVLVAAAADPRNAAPVEGTFSGVGVSSRLDFELSISLQP